MSLRLVRMLVKVIPAVLLFAQSTTKQFWLEWYHMEVDVVKQENLGYMEKSISLKSGFGQVTPYSFDLKQKIIFKILKFFASQLFLLFQIQFKNTIRYK